MPITPLTPKQKEIVLFVAKYYQQYGHAPSLEEIAKKFEKAVSTIHQHIELIQKKGYLQKDAFQSRSIAPLIESEAITEVPLLGTIAAGQPIEPYENPEPVSVPKSMIGQGSNYYALHVKGDSMIQDGIWDGDTVVIKHKTTLPTLGEIIVAVVDGEATLKRFGGIKNGEVTLLPRNPSLEPIIRDASTFEVRGTFVGLLHKEKN